MQVLQQMAQGKNNASIAQTMFLSDSAVEKHVNAIFSKLGLSDEAGTHHRVAAVLAFLREADR
jgi:DNA-binding NarL/FixJ family response regulator